jgi:hypothetical protein
MKSEKKLVFFFVLVYSIGIMLVFNAGHFFDFPEFPDSDLDLYFGAGSLLFGLVFLSVSQNILWRYFDLIKNKAVLPNGNSVKKRESGRNVGAWNA